MRWLCAAQALHVLSIENFDQAVKCALSCCTDDTGTESELVSAQHPVDKCSFSLDQPYTRVHLSEKTGWNPGEDMRFAQPNLCSQRQKPLIIQRMGVMAFWIRRASRCAQPDAGPA